MTNPNDVTRDPYDPTLDRTDRIDADGTAPENEEHATEAVGAGAGALAGAGVGMAVGGPVGAAVGGVVGAVGGAVAGEAMDGDDEAGAGVGGAGGAITGALVGGAVAGPPGAVVGGAVGAAGGAGVGDQAQEEAEESNPDTTNEVPALAASAHARSAGRLTRMRHASGPGACRLLSRRRPRRRAPLGGRLDDGQRPTARAREPATRR